MVDFWSWICVKMGDGRRYLKGGIYIIFNAYPILRNTQIQHGNSIPQQHFKWQIMLYYISCYIILSPWHSPGEDIHHRSLALTPQTHPNQWAHRRHQLERLHWFLILPQWGVSFWYGCRGIWRLIIYMQKMEHRVHLFWICVLVSLNAKLEFISLSTGCTMLSKIPDSDSKSMPTILNSCRKRGSRGTCGLLVTWPKRLTKRLRIQASVLIALPGQTLLG